MADDPARYPELTAELKNRSFSGALRIFGPGAIIASVTVGSGETVFASRGGAIFGYTLLWCFVVSAVLKGIQVYSGARFITLTGKHPLESWVELPGPRGWFVWLLALLTVVWMPFWLGGGLPKMLGEFTNWIVGFPDSGDPAQFALYGKVWATVFILTAIAFTWFQSYGFLERVQTILISGLLICMVAAAIASTPDVLSMMVGTIFPRPPQYDPWVAAKYPKFLTRNPWVEMVVYLGAIGGGTQDYFGYLGLLRAKAWGMLGRIQRFGDPAPTGITEDSDNHALGRAWLRAPAADVFISFLAILLFTYAFVVLGAAVLHPHHEVPSGTDLLTLQLGYLVRADQAVLFQWVMGFIYKTGVFFAFFGTIFGAYELYTWTIRECLIPVIPRLRTVAIEKFRLAAILWVGGGGLALLWGLDKDPIVIVTPAALVGSSLTCGLWCFAIMWSDRVHTPKALRMGAKLKIAVLISGIFLTFIPIVGITKYVQGFF